MGTGRGEVRTQTLNKRASLVNEGRLGTSSQPTSTVQSSWDTLHPEGPQSAPYGPEGPLAAAHWPAARTQRAAAPSDHPPP